MSVVLVVVSALAAWMWLLGAGVTLLAYRFKLPLSQQLSLAILWPVLLPARTAWLLCRDALAARRGVLAR